MSFRRPVFLYLTTLAFTGILIFSLLFHWAEIGVNPHISSYFDTFYYSVSVTTGVGLGDIFPFSKLGKFITMMMMFLGTGLYVSFTGILAATILEIELEARSNSDQSDS